MSFLQDNLNIILSALFSGGTGGVLGLVLGGKKRKATDSQEEEKANKAKVDTFKAMQETYGIFAQDMNEKYLYLEKELIDIKLENKEQRKSLRNLQKDNNELHVQITSLTKENNELKTIVTKLSLENKQLHAQLNKKDK